MSARPLSGLVPVIESSIWLGKLAVFVPESRLLIREPDRGEVLYYVPRWIVAMWKEYEALPVEVQQEMGSEQWVKQMIRPAIEAAIDQINAPISPPIPR